MGGFTSSTQTQNNTGKWEDPYANVAGAAALRSQLFNYLGGSMGQANQAGQQYAQGLQTAAANPGWQTAQTNAQNNAAGDYLNGSPQLDQAMAYNRAAAQSSAADQQARIKDQYAKNGMQFSTAGQEAQQSTNAAANASANAQDAQMKLQNYTSERANQNAAGSQLAQATGAPLQYLSAVPGAYSSGQSPYASTLGGLVSGGSMYTTRSSAEDNPSLMSSVQSGMGGL
jgi:hypothetical protein